MLEEKVEQLDLFLEPREEVQEEEAEKPRYKIPGRTAGEELSYHGGRMAWLKEFFDANGISKPKGFHGFSSRQSYGLYKGVLNTYGIDENEDIIRR